MGGIGTLACHALEVLNIPLSDAYLGYWTLKAFYKRVEQCKHISAIYNPREDQPLPTLVQINAAKELLLLKDGFEIARGLADGQWQCRWSPQTPSPHIRSLALSKRPPAPKWQLIDASSDSEQPQFQVKSSSDSESRPAPPTTRPSYRHFKSETTLSPHLSLGATGQGGRHIGNNPASTMGVTHTGLQQMSGRIKHGLKPLDGKWLVPCALSMMFCTDDPCFPDFDDGALFQPQGRKRVKRAPSAKAHPVAATVKLEKGAGEDGESSELEIFGGSDPEDAEAVPDWLCSLHETDHVRAVAI